MIDTSYKEGWDEGGKYGFSLAVFFIGILATVIFASYSPYVAWLTGLASVPFGIVIFKNTPWASNE